MGVSLSHARALLGCVADQPAAERLLRQLFYMRWCWRPEEMTEKRVDPVTGEEIDVCVWGAAGGHTARVALSADEYAAALRQFRVAAEAMEPDVADGPQSVILDQVANGLAVRMAVLYYCAGGAA